MKQLRIFVLITIFSLTFWTSRCALAQSPKESNVRRIGLLDWNTDYSAAYQQARQEHKQLLIFFRDSNAKHVADSYEKNVLASDSLWVPLSGYVRAVVPLDIQAPTKSAGESSSRLVDDPAFEQLQRRQGIVTIDLSDRKSSPYGLVTAAHPFASGLHYSVSSTSVVLGLPRGTLTQRALIYALRMHPQGPQLANLGMSAYLCEQARQHSSVMAQVEQVGHHNWGNRFQTISGAVGHGVNEVAASGNGGTIIDAAISCVAAWRSSPGHWSIITSNPLIYGYDLARGNSGQWYATGIIGSGR